MHRDLSEETPDGGRVKVALFPGQGISSRSILDSLVRDHPLLFEANDTLRFDLRRRVESVARTSSRSLPTSVAQPAIFVASLIAWAERSADDYDFLLGHSLGEYAALVASGALSFHHGLCVVQVRGEVMEATGRHSAGGMAAILGLGLEDVEEIAAECAALIANDNCPGEVVVAGSEESLATIAPLVRSKGGRTVLLGVASAFHTPVMAPAEVPLRDALDHVSCGLPKKPVLSNVTTMPYRHPGEIRKVLVTQLTHRVRFRECLERLWDLGVDRFQDFGPGDVVGRLAGRTFASLDAREGRVSA